jgi:hypothetical protein
MMERYLKKLLINHSSCIKITIKNKNIEYKNKNKILKINFCFLTINKKIFQTITINKKNKNI